MDQMELNGDKDEHGADNSSPATINELCKLYFSPQVIRDFAEFNKVVVLQADKQATKHGTNEQQSK